MTGGNAEGAWFGDGYGFHVAKVPAGATPLCFQAIGGQFWLHMQADEKARLVHYPIFQCEDGQPLPDAIDDAVKIASFEILNEGQVVGMRHFWHLPPHVWRLALDQFKTEQS